LAVALAIFFISPIDDVIFSALFGSLLFGFGSLPFYIILFATSIISLIFWLSHKQSKGAGGQVKKS
jgi:hypothetical protein